MKKFSLLLGLLLVGVLGFTGCSSVRTMDDPAQIGENGWNIEYIIVDNDNQAVPCLWNSRVTNQAVISCDWDAKTTEIPEGAERNQVGEGSWTIEYVEYGSKTIPCLWNSRGSKQAVMSCDF